MDERDRVTEFQLRFERMAQQHAITAELKADDTAYEAFSNLHMQRFMATMLTEKHPGTVHRERTTVTFAEPASWWQHWKIDHAHTWYGGWIQNRWPAEMTVRIKPVMCTFEFDPMTLFPQHPDNNRRKSWGTNVRYVEYTPRWQIGDEL